MTMSWVIWMAFVIVGLVGLGLYIGGVVATVRAYGMGKGRIFRGVGAPIAWAGMALLLAAGIGLAAYIFSP